ncbi:hypothetical protein [Clostridium sp. BJN0001]|uniref:hypothetical protein n=1 Tax=Clostridium sp. BJN0001 TaxID=2930219 RepID=UPI001FD21BA1|nr:hypothetical protein [Clostridium sp. BJN0001]
MKSKLTDQHKLMAYILNKEMNYSMTAIGVLMKVSQSTISNAIKEVDFRRTVSNLKAELAEAKSALVELGYNEPTILPPNPNK